MGFAESDVLDALRINGNNQDTAVRIIIEFNKSYLNDFSFNN